MDKLENYKRRLINKRSSIESGYERMRIDLLIDMIESCEKNNSKVDCHNLCLALEKLSIFKESGLSG